MTLALQLKPPRRSPLDSLAELRERIDSWQDLATVASVATAWLQEEVREASVFTFRFDPASDAVVLLAVAPLRPGVAAVGSRQPLGSGLLAAALRKGTKQRRLDGYVEPDFVHSLPGETHSELAVPLRVGGQVRGALYLDYPAPHKPTEQDELLVELVAGYLEIAFDADRSAAASGGGGGGADRLRHTATLTSIAGQIAHGEDNERLRQRIVDAAVEITGCSGALLLLRHPSRQMLELAAASGSVPPAPMMIPLDGSLPGAVTRDGRSRAVKRLGVAPDQITAADAELGFNDALAVPITNAGKTTGALVVVNRGSSGIYPAETVELLQDLANLVGMAESMRLVAQLRQRLSDASMVAEVGRAITGTLGLDDVLAVVVQAAQMLVSGQCATVALIAEGQDSLTLAATSGTLRSSRGDRLPISDSLIGWVATQGEPVITECVSEDRRGHPHAVRLGPGAVVPLEYRGKPRGALLAARAEGTPAPSDEDVDALRKLAAYAAIAIDNAHLYQEQTELSRALRAQTEELERAYGELNESQDRLVISEKMAALGRITAGIAHEINSPLGSILNCLQLAQTYGKEYESSVQDPEVTTADHLGIAKDLLETLNLAEGATRKVAQFVRTIKGQTRMEDDEMRDFDPVEEIATTLPLLQHEVRNARVEIHTAVQPGLRLVGDPGKFGVLLQNLVSNAIDAYAGEAGEVFIRLSGTAEAVVLEVEDCGCGIPEDIRGRIFDYLFTTKDVGQGTGLGLSLVHSIATSHFKGSVALRSEMGVGTTFTITLPAPAEAA